MNGLALVINGTIWLQEKTIDTIRYYAKYRDTIRYDMASKCCAAERVAATQPCCSPSRLIKTALIRHARSVSDAVQM